MTKQNIVAVVTTGGTIGAIMDDKSIVTSSEHTELREKLHRVAEKRDVKIVVCDLFDKLSEDMQPEDWGLLIHKIQELRNKGISRILITHGTDTIAYTATALALLFGPENQSSDEGLRICLVAAYFPIENKKSDAEQNLVAGFEAISNGKIKPGVYVSFTTKTNPSSGKVTQTAIIPAFTLKPMHFDERILSGIFGQVTATFTDKHGINMMTPKYDFVEHPPTISNSPLPTPTQLSNAASRLFLGDIHPGMNLEKLSGCLQTYDVVILGLYHSGTGPTYDNASSLTRFVQRLKSNTTVMLATFPKEYIETPYDSTLRLIESGAYLYVDLQPHQIYVILTIGLAQGRQVDELINMLVTWQYRT